MICFTNDVVLCRVQLKMINLIKIVNEVNDLLSIQWRDPDPGTITGLFCFTINWFTYWCRQVQTCSRYVGLQNRSRVRSCVNGWETDYAFAHTHYGIDSRNAAEMSRMFLVRNSSSLFFLVWNRLLTSCSGILLLAMRSLSFLFYWMDNSELVP